MSVGFFFSGNGSATQGFRRGESPYNALMKKLTLIASLGALGLLAACGEDTGRVTKVQPKPPVAASEKVPGPDDAFNAGRKLQSTSDAPPTMPKGKKSTK